MMASNLPVAWRNVIDFMACETSKKAFLWAASRNSARLAYREERYARELSDLLSVWRWIAPQAAAQCPLPVDGESLSDLERFLIKRHAGQWWGSNLRMWWE